MHTYKHIPSKLGSYFCSENNPNLNCFWCFVILRAIVFNSEEYMKQQLLGQLTTNMCMASGMFYSEPCVKWLKPAR